MFYDLEKGFKIWLKICLTKTCFLQYIPSSMILSRLTTTFFSKTEIELRLTDCSFKSWESSMWFSYFSCHPPSRSSFLQLKMDNLKQNNENKVEKWKSYLLKLSKFPIISFIFCDYYVLFNNASLIKLTRLFCYIDFKKYLEMEYFQLSSLSILFAVVLL